MSSVKRWIFNCCQNYSTTSICLLCKHHSKSKVSLSRHLFPRAESGPLTIMSVQISASKSSITQSSTIFRQCVSTNTATIRERRWASGGPTMDTSWAFTQRFRGSRRAAGSETLVRLSHSGLNLTQNCAKFPRQKTLSKESTLHRHTCAGPIASVCTIRHTRTIQVGRTRQLKTGKSSRA